VRRSGNVKSVQRNTLFILIGKRIPKYVVPRNTNVTVAPSSPGSNQLSNYLIFQKWKNNSLHVIMICRRDSFITHRAFCDALSDENNKFNEAGQLPSLMHGPNLQPPIIPNLVASLPMNNTNNHKPPLSLPHDLIAAIPAKPFNSNMSALTRSLSSTSSPSQLCSNSPNINMFEESAQTHMSATALLQKAAQMGATVNGNSNSMMAEKGFATSMAPPSYGVMNNHAIHNGQQELSHYNFHANGAMMDGGGGGGSSMGGMSGLDMFNAILDQSKALSKIIEQNNRSSYSGVLHAMNNGRSTSIDVGGSKGSENVMTLDLLGIGGGGGGGGDGNFFGGEQPELKMEYGEISQIRIQGLNHFQQQTAAYEN